MRVKAIELAISFFASQGRHDVSFSELINVAEGIHDFLEKEYQGSIAPGKTMVLPEPESNPF